MVVEQRGTWEVPTQETLQPANPPLEEEDVPSYQVKVHGFVVSDDNTSVIFNLIVSRGGASWPLRRRFNQVVELHEQLLLSLGGSEERRRMPSLPPFTTLKGLLYGRTDSRFLAERATSIERYLGALLRFIPYVDQCEVLRDWLCSVDMRDLAYEDLLDLGDALGRAGLPRGLDSSSIAALPSRVADSALASSPTFCVVCQEPMLNRQDIRELHCGHHYHFQCISVWLAEVNSCCICQASVPGLLEHQPEKSSSSK